MNVTPDKRQVFLEGEKMILAVVKVCSEAVFIDMIYKIMTYEFLSHKHFFLKNFQTIIETSVYFIMCILFIF